VSALRLRTLALLLLLAAAVLLAGAISARAYFTASGAVSARASATTLPAPASVRASFTAAGTVALSWPAVTAPASGTVSYYVSRDGGAPSSACPSSAAPTTATSCADTGVSAGAHAYTVTAVWRSWTRTSASASVVVSYGVATQLAFTTQPAGATGGSAFATQPVVTARDASGNTVADYNGAVTLSILSGGSAGAALSGCVGALSAGVTTFSGCKIDKSGSSYVLRASDRAFTVDSASFNVSVGPVAQLVFTTQPGGGAVAGTAFPSQPVVTAVDAGGNAVNGYNATVTLTIASGTSGAALSGCATRGARQGVTTFDGCKFDKSGTYVLRAGDGTRTADSAAFAVVAGAVSRLVFSTQPGGGATGGTAFPSQPVVTALDALGNVATGYAGTVALSIASGGTAGAVLSGCLGTLRDGVTTFAGCKVNKVGTGYVLRASDGTRTVDSAAFNVTAGPASQLLFTTQPAGAVAGAAFTTQPVITAYDAGGNVATGYLGTIVLSIVRGTGASSGALSGCSPTRSNGVTTFRTCSISRSGTGYVLRGSDGTLSVDSTPFNVG